MSHPHLRDENPEVHWGLVTCPKVMHVMAVKIRFQSGLISAKAHTLDCNANFISKGFPRGEAGEERENQIVLRRKDMAVP